MAEESYPENLRYHEAHDWARAGEAGEAEFGVTWHAQDALGDIVFIDLPSPGDRLVAGEPYGEVESVKAVSDIVAPLAGEVLAVNDGVVDAPERLNDDPYGAWLVRVRLDDPQGLDTLMDAATYRRQLG